MRRRRPVLDGYVSFLACAIAVGACLGGSPARAAGECDAYEAATLAGGAYDVPSCCADLQTCTGDSPDLARPAVCGSGIAADTENCPSVCVKSDKCNLHSCNGDVWVAEDVQSLLNGFNAVTFVKTNPDGSREVVISFRGTTDWVDGITDGLQLLNLGMETQYIAALAYYNYISTIKYPNQKIEVTGHSLGGSLALYVGGMTGAQTTAFNPLGLSDDLEQKLRRSNQSMDNITSYVDENDAAKCGNYLFEMWVPGNIVTRGSSEVQQDCHQGYLDFLDCAAAYRRVLWEDWKNKAKDLVPFRRDSPPSEFTSEEIARCTSYDDKKRKITEAHGMQRMEDYLRGECSSAPEAALPESPAAPEIINPWIFDAD